MKCHAHFLQKHASNGKNIESLGTDAIFRLDGRKNIDGMRQDAINRARQFKIIHPEYIGAAIYRGNIRKRIKISEILF